MVKISVYPCEIKQLYKNGKAIPRFEKFIKLDPFTGSVALISEISDKF